MDELSGIVREVIREVDPNKRLDVPTTSVGIAALGPIGQGSVGQIHSPSPVEEDLLESFTAYVPTVLLDGLRPHVSVSVTLEAVDVLGSDCVWFCKQIVVHR